MYVFKFYLLVIYSLKQNNLNHKNLHGVRAEPLMANYLPHCLELNPAHFSYGKDDDLLS